MVKFLAIKNIGQDLHENPIFYMCIVSHTFLDCVGEF